MLLSFYITLILFIIISSFLYLIFAWRNALMILLAYELASTGLVFGNIYLSSYFLDGTGYIIALVILAISGGVELPIGLSLVIRYFDLFKSTRVDTLVNTLN